MGDIVDKLIALVERCIDSLSGTASSESERIELDNIRFELGAIQAEKEDLEGWL